MARAGASRRAPGKAAAWPPQSKTRGPRGACGLRWQRHRFGSDGLRHAGASWRAAGKAAAWPPQSKTRGPRPTKRPGRPPLASRPGAKSSHAAGEQDAHLLFAAKGCAGAFRFLAFPSLPSATTQRTPATSRASRHASAVRTGTRPAGPEAPAFPILPGGSPVMTTTHSAGNRVLPFSNCRNVTDKNPTREVLHDDSRLARAVAPGLSSSLVRGDPLGMG